MSQAKPFCISKQAVFDAWMQVKRNRGTSGIDGQTIEEFEENLKDNLYKLWNRLSSGSYFPPPVQGVEIPKRNGKMRLLGIPTVMDRIAQTVVRNCLEPTLDPIFCSDSYAYRSNKSAIDSIAITRIRCWKYSWVLEFDIKGAFDNIDHSLMLKALSHHTSCKWVLMYIERWLKAPMVKSDGIKEARTQGTPQGGVISPLLFNLYLHYAFDEWMKREFPTVPFARYADDGLLHCCSEQQAAFIRDKLGLRLKACGLQLHPDKTKIVYCKDANRRGDYINTQFVFLGYCFRGRLAKSKEGKYFCSFSPAVSKEASKAIRGKMKEWNISRWTNASLEDISKRINPVINGWWNYYSKFYPSEMKKVLMHLDLILEKWAVRKHKRFKRSKCKAKLWLAGVKARDPSLLAHWSLLNTA